MPISRFTHPQDEMDTAASEETVGIEVYSKDEEPEMLAQQENFEMERRRDTDAFPLNQPYSDEEDEEDGPGPGPRAHARPPARS